MRSILLSLALASFAAVGATAAAPWTGAPAAGSRCPEQALAHLARPNGGALHKKLTDLPPADAYLAVFRRDANGCVVPVKTNFRNQRPSERSPAGPVRRR